MCIRQIDLVYTKKKHMFYFKTLAKCKVISKIKSYLLCIFVKFFSVSLILTITRVKSTYEQMMEIRISYTYISFILNERNTRSMPHILYVCFMHCILHIKIILFQISRYLVNTQIKYTYENEQKQITYLKALLIPYSCCYENILFTGIFYIVCVRLLFENCVNLLLIMYSVSEKIKNLRSCNCL